MRAQQLNTRQFANDLIGSHAWERADALALHRPLELHLQLASGCNLDCYMCHEHLRPESARHGRGMQFLDERILEEIERDVMPYSSRLHLGVGGEPMLAPRFLDLVERAHARNQRIHLTTNGTRIATERVAAVLARCVSTIEISADGATAETYERVRRGASFARLVQNIELLNRHRLEHEPQDRARLTLCMVLLGSNTHELPLFVELAARLGADGVAAWPSIPVTPEGRADAFDPERARPFLEQARARGIALGIALDLPFDRGADGAPDPANERTAALRRLGDLETRSNGAARNGAAGNGAAGNNAAAGNAAHARHFCHMPTLALYVMWDGRVYPCANPEAHQGDALGRLGQETFESIWNGRKYRNLRAGLARGDAPETCRHCPILHRAAGPLPRSGSDLVSWFGDRDLAPVASGSVHGEILARADVPGRAEWVEQAVTSGLAESALHRIEEQMRYARALEERVRALEGTADRLLHEHAAAGLQVSALEAERPHLLGHASTLETELGKAVLYARSLEDRLRALERNVERSAHEHGALQLELAAAQAEHARLAQHASTLARDLGHVTRHAAAIEAERASLAGHAFTLETERWHLARHAVGLEAERKHLILHAADLEHILDRVRGRAIHRFFSRIKDAFVAPRPKPAVPYVPPWVEDGTRKPGEPVGRIPDEPPLCVSDRRPSADPRTTDA